MVHKLGSEMGTSDVIDRIEIYDFLQKELGSYISLAMAQTILQQCKDDLASVPSNEQDTMKASLTMNGLETRIAGLITSLNNLQTQQHEHGYIQWGDRFTLSLEEYFLLGQLTTKYENIVALIAQIRRTHAGRLRS